MEPGMLNENQNRQHWLARLEDPQGLPEECVQDKEAAWQQLQARLQPSSSRKKNAWFWAAAACLLVVISVPILTAKKDQAVTVNKRQSLPMVEKAIAIPQLPTRETTILTNPTVVSRAKQLNRPDNKNSIKKLSFRAPVVNRLSPSPAVIIQPLNNPSLAATQRVTVVTVKYPVALSPAKKLKVVHVNELGETTPDAYPMVRMEDNGASRVRLFNRELFSNAGSGAMGSGFNIFKSKNTPSN